MDSAPSLSRTLRLSIIFALALGYVMAMLDATAVNVALDKIASEFQAPLSALVWVVDAYTLTFAALLLLGGALADRLGAKRAYLLGLAWFIIASAFCALASSAVELIIARLFQGFGVALFMPSSISLIGETFPDEAQRTKLVVIDGGRLRTRWPESVKQRGEEGLLGINAIAETYWQIHRQPRSAWTQEIDLRPFKESF